MALADNPVIYLTRKMWEFSEGNRKNVVLYVTLFIFGNIVNFFEPLVVGYVLNLIQERGYPARTLSRYCSGLAHSSH